MRTLIKTSVLISAILASSFSWADRIVDYTVTPPTTRVDRSPLPDSEISGYIIEEYVDARLVNTYTTTKVFPYRGRAIPDTGKITVRVATVDTDNQRSAFTALINILAVPSAPGGLSGVVIITSTTTTTTTIQANPGVK
jgi:hypothetical protein